MSFVEDPDFEKKLRRSRTLRAVLLQEAEETARLAKMISPRNTSYFVERVEAQKDADGVRVTSTDPFAHLVEFGSINNPAYAPLRRAADARLEFDEAPKT